MKTIYGIDWRRVQTDRDLAGEWRILRAKIRHVIDRTCVFAGKLAHDEGDAHAVETLRRCVLDYLDGRPFRVPPIELAFAVARLLETDPIHAYDRAA